jgi:prophage DNA circulation protein
MVSYEFAATKPSLVYAYRLYDDASRGDGLRVENKVVHPAFMPRIGRAMSA